MEIFRFLRSHGISTGMELHYTYRWNGKENKNNLSEIEINWNVIVPETFCIIIFIYISYFVATFRLV